MFPVEFSRFFETWSELEWITTVQILKKVAQFVNELKSFFSMAGTGTRQEKPSKKKKLWSTQKLGYKNYSHDHGKSEYSITFFDFGLDDTMPQKKVPKNAILDHFHPQNPPFTQRRVLKISVHMQWGALCMCTKNYENRSIQRYPKMAKTG